MELLEAIKKADHVYICGNGGSAANAIHMANDLISAGIKAHALTSDIATVTAIANDYSYEKIFAGQIAVFCKRGDLLICLSGSGKSPNIIRAIHEARMHGTTTCAIFGAYNDLPWTDEADIMIRDGADMQAAEEAQLRITHDLMRSLKDGK